MSAVSNVQEKFIRLGSYIKHWYIANPTIGHGIHSPFMYALFTNCFYKKSRIGSYRLEWEFLSNLLKDVNGDLKKKIDAGKQKRRSLQKTIMRSASSVSDTQALCDMVCFLNPTTIIELGTSAGLTTRALALAAPKTKIISIEGNTELYTIAKNHLRAFANIHLHNNLFDDILPVLTWDITKPIFVFIDGNHTYEASLRYVKFFLEKATVGSTIVLHDIRWSVEMMRAWKEIKSLEFIGVTLESYTTGMIFLREGILKQEFRIKY